MAKKASRYKARKKKSAEKQKHARERRAQFKKRQRNKKIINYSVIAVIVIAVVYGIFIATSGDDTGQYDELAKCITQSGAIMYGTDWCPHCQDQKRLFGKSFKYVNYINCDLNGAACELAGIRGYPTWVFADGESVSGQQSLEFLAARTECEA